MGYWDTLKQQMSNFLAQDAARRGGMASGPTAAVSDRKNEGALMAALLGPVAPVATIPVGAIAAGYEGLKGLGQATGLGKYFPGPFKTDETTSTASLENPLALVQGFSEQANTQPSITSLLQALAKRV